MTGTAFATGFVAGAVAMLAASIVQDQTPNFISRGVVKAGWGQSDGRVYRVTPAEVVASQEHRP